MYNHFGKTYLVDSVREGEVILEDLPDDYQHLRSEGVFWATVRCDAQLQGLRYGERLAACYGGLTVHECFGGYKLVDVRSGTVVKEAREKTVAVPSDVRGFWLEVDDEALLGAGGGAAEVFAFEQILRIGAPFVIPCDRHDLGTYTASRQTVYLYETVPGGIGVAEKAVARWPEIVRTGIEIAERCKCASGCPSCVVPPRLPAGQAEPRKDAAIRVAKNLLEVASGGYREVFDPATHTWRKVSS